MVNNADCLYWFGNKRKPATELHFEICTCCGRATLRDEIGYTDLNAIKNKAQALSIIFSRLDGGKITQEVFNRVKAEIEASDFPS
jgi:hypothetical protein